MPLGCWRNPPNVYELAKMVIKLILPMCEINVLTGSCFHHVIFYKYYRFSEQ